jgi:class 3 adenylate cyclase
MTTDEVKRKLAAIMSADVKEYSRLMREDEAATVRTLTEFRGLMATLIKQHHGRVVDSPGDNILAEFASVVDAVQGAVAVQRELRTRNAEIPDNRKMLFRIGINLGDVIVEQDRIYGDGVNIAARLEGLADPGGICISRTAFDQIEDKLPLGYEYLGEKTLKNIDKPVRAYRVLLEPHEGTWRVRKEKEADRQERHFKIEGASEDRHARRRAKEKRWFRRHLKMYIGVIGFLFIINMLTYSGTLWFYWPALGWGFFLFLQWRPEFTSLSKRKVETRPDTSDRQL